MGVSTPRPVSDIVPVSPAKIVLCRISDIFDSGLTPASRVIRTYGISAMMDSARRLAPNDNRWTVAVFVALEMGWVAFVLYVLPFLATL